MVPQNRTSFRAKGEKGELGQHFKQSGCCNLMATGEATREQLGCLGSGRVLGRWRLSQVCLRPELGSCSRSRSHGSYVFIIDLEGARGGLVTVIHCEYLRLPQVI